MATPPFRGEARLEAQELRQLVLEHELGEAALAELLTEADEGLVADLLAERQPPAVSPVCGSDVVISKRSTSSALPIDLPSGDAMNPLAIPPAVSASDARSPVPRSLTERLK